MESGTIVKSASDVPMKDGAVPAPLTEEEIRKYVGYYKEAAKNAISGVLSLDGVELHRANGYLIDQFT
jgi:NADPH2 dehydrogenase